MFFLYFTGKYPVIPLNLFDLTLNLSGFPIKSAKSLLSEIQSKSENDFEDYVNHQKKEIVHYHLHNNPFYKNLVGKTEAKAWDDLPVLKKSDLQKPLEKRLSKGFKMKDVYVNKTSGSSGDPFVFAKDKFAHAMTWAVIQDRFGWFGLNFNTSKQARFYGIPLDRRGYLKERLKDSLSKRFRFSVFDLSEKAFESCLTKFQNTSFDYINGYTSAIVQFAKFLNKKQLILKELCPSLKACIVTSEMLFEYDKNLMQQQFGVPIINEYGALERDVIAGEHPSGYWQVNSETLFLEILDDNDQALPRGKEGRVVITSLFNKANPFIRYDIGDIASLSENSTIKEPILKSLIGRANDLIHLPSGKTAAGLTFYYVTKSIIEDSGNVKEFTVTQNTLHHFIIHYTSEIELSEAEKNVISKEINKYLEDGLEVEFVRCLHIPRSKSGKLKQFTSSVNFNT